MVAPETGPPGGRKMPEVPSRRTGGGSGAAGMAADGAGQGFGEPHAKSEAGRIDRLHELGTWLGEILAGKQQPHALEDTRTWRKRDHGTAGCRFPLQAGLGAREGTSRRCDSTAAKPQAARKNIRGRALPS